MGLHIPSHPRLTESRTHSIVRTEITKKKFHTSTKNNNNKDNDSGLKIG